MNFLLNALEAHNNEAGDDDYGDDGAGGWGSDEDIDLSDDEETTDYDTENTGGYDTEVTPQLPEENDNNPIRMGGGMFMGRLTQFLDVVAPQQDEGDGWDHDDDDVEGWEDDDAQEILSMLDSEDDPAISEASPNVDTSTVYTNQAVVAPTSVEPESNASYGAETLSSTLAGVGIASTSGFTTEEENHQGDGWGDEDDGVDGLLEAVEANEPVFYPPPPPPPQPADHGDGWGDDSAVDFSFGDDDEAAETIESAPVAIPPPPPPPPPPPVPQPPSPTENGDGWGDDVGDLSFGDELADTIETAETPQFVDPTPPPPPPPPPPVAQPTIPTHHGDGWDDDDAVDLTFGDELADTIETAETPQFVDPTPPPPPPPPPVAQPTIPTHHGDGWDDDDVGDLTFGDEVAETIETAETPQFVDPTPPPPPPPPVTQPDITTDHGDGWDDDDAADLTFGDEMAETIETGTEAETPHVVDLTPPPPPPVAHGDGWDDDVAVDLTFGDAADTIETGTQAETPPVVDLTPPPPPPPPPPPVAQSAITTNDVLEVQESGDGWGNDDEFDIVEENDNDDSKNVVVDHIPPPPPPKNPIRSTTIDATDGDDDISQDDTLSIANSRSQQNAVGGYRTASMSTMGDVSDYDPASVDLEGDADIAARSVSTVGSGSAGGGKLASRKVVDYTPRQARGMTADASLLVAGHTSVGESLDSIDEANEEDYENDIDIDNAEALRRLNINLSSEAVADADTSVTPRTMESGWGALRQQQLQQQSQTETGSSDIPFGSAVTPTATNSDAVNRFGVPSPEVAEDTNASSGGEDKVEFPLVDHTPEVVEDPGTGFPQGIPLSRKASVANSVDVLSVSSEEGDLGESDTVGVDDIREELYGPMVDQIPPTPKDDLNRRKRMSGQASVEGGGSTVVGQAENQDVANDIRQDDAMDEEEEDEDEYGVEESSKGWGSTLAGEFDNRSLLSGLPLPVVDETQYLVDHVPLDQLLRGRSSGGIGAGAASMMVMMDASTASSRAEDNVVDDGSNPVNFGPIVDQTPGLNTSMGVRGTPSMTTSVATAVSDGDIKEDDDMDNTTVEGCGAGAGGAISTGDEDGGMTENDDDDSLDDDHIVDHVPEGKVQPAAQDASVCVVVGKDDDMTQVDTIVEDIPNDFGPIVDHTPVPFSRVSSGALSVGASLLPQRNATDDNNTATLGSISEQDDNSDWDHDEPDMDDLSTGDDIEASNGVTEEENNLVDYIPKRTFSKPVDGSTIVLVDPVDAASEVDDADDDTVGNARTDKFGPVVDQTPAPRSAPISLTTSMVNHATEINRQDTDIDGSATWFGASTLGGVSSAGGEGSLAADDDTGTGWDDDDQVLEDLASPAVPPRGSPIHDPGSHLVDHVPSLTSPQQIDTNASTAVAVDPSVISAQSQDDKIGGGIFGAVVDHTPSVEPAVDHGDDNSTLVTGFANTKRDDDLDETTWQGGVSAQGEGWDQDDPELEDIADDAEDESPHVVDHVPERPESRYADPSLIVAANPSEMSSQVEDLNQDENHFGPVVDQTPLERVLPPPAVGSTVVALPSILNDVSDEGDGDTTEAARVPSEWEDQLPNPQSGNDTETGSEQLVDAVPPPPEPQVFVRDASSEMATVDDKSTLAPADEQKEDEFGPVVDHTPSGEDVDHTDSNSSSSDREEDEDKKPAANLDSVAPNCSVETEDKEDGLDEDEFGPVVDQLPAISSRSSLAPSKGGSTVDALATVSEGEDDFNTRDGWDDDTLDVIDQTSPTNTSHRANHSVTWDDNIYKKDVVGSKTSTTSNAPDDMGESGFFSAEMSALTQADMDETKFYDPETNETNGWVDDSLNIADDETPPSTPRPTAIFQSNGSTECPSCFDANGTDCPCIQTLIQTNGAKNGMVGLMEMPNGNSVKIDFQKLLQNETAKRILIEKESEALRQMVESLKAAKESLVAAGEKQMNREGEMMSAVNKWQEANGELQEANGELSSENKQITDDLMKLQSENDLLTSELKSVRQSMLQLEGEKSQIQLREAALRAEIENLRTSLEKRIQQSTSDDCLQAQISAAQLELSSKVSECSELNSKLIIVQEELNKSEAQNFKHTKDLAKSTQEYSKQITELQSQLDAYSKELEEASRRNQESIAILEERLSFEAEANQNLQEENNSLAVESKNLHIRLQHTGEQQYELIQKEATIQSLNVQLKNFQDENLQLSDQVSAYAQEVERLSSLSMELESISRERDVLKEALVDSKTHIAGLQKKVDDLSSSLDLNAPDQESILNALQEDRERQSLEIETLTQRINVIESQKNAVHVEFEAFKQMHANSQNAAAASALNVIKEEAKVKKMQKELQQLRLQLQNSVAGKQGSENECTRLSSRCAELEKEMSRLSELTAQLDMLQNDLLQFQEANESQAQNIRSLESDIMERERILTLKDQEITNLQNQQNLQSCTIARIENEKKGLITDLESNRSRMAELEFQREDAEGKISTLQRFNEEMQLLVADKNTLQNEMESLTYERDALQKEKEDLNVDNEEMLVQFGLLNEEMVEKEEELRRIQEEMAEKEEELRRIQEELHFSKNELENTRREYEEELARKDQECEEELSRKDQELQTKDHDLQLAQREYENKLKTSEEKLNALIRESEEMTKNFDNDDGNAKKLVEINGALRDKIREMVSEQSATVEQIRAMESHKLGLTGKVEDLQNLVDELISSFEAKEGKLQSTIDSTTYEKNEYYNKSIAQEAEISRLNQELSVSNGYAEECTILRGSLTELENQLSEQDRLLLQKDAAAQDLFNQLQNAGQAPMESAELEMLRQKVQEQEAHIANDKQQLQEMSTVCDETQQELTRTMEQLSSSEEIARQLQDDLQSKQDIESTNQMLESRLDQLERELMSARTEESKHRDEASNLSQQLSNVTVSNATKEHNVSTELATLRRQVAAFEREKNTLSSAATAREKAMEEELRALRNQLAEKDGRIASMEDKLESVSSDLSQSKEESNAKQQSIGTLTAELEQVKAIASDPSTLRMLELARGQAESIDNMRSQIVALAQALEKSEYRRAETIDNTERERQAHAESLRRMTVNVKRFYSTLKMSER